MIRFAATGLDRWFKSPNRKPLILRGARQVGKTWLVRDFAQRHRLALVELNFEKLPNLAELFSVNDPREIVGNLEAEFSISITPETSCLFLDEIQAVPELLAKLRWFKEELPQLAVIGLLVAWGQSWFALAIAASVAAQLAAMRVLLRDPKGKAPWYNGTGVMLYVLGMMVTAFALRGLA